MNYLDFQARSKQRHLTYIRRHGFGGALILTIGLALAGSAPAQTDGHRVPRRTNLEPARRGSEFGPLDPPVAANPNTDQGPGPGPIGPGPGCNLFPAPPSVGASVGLSYFGPSPAESNPSLVGPVQLLKSGTVDVKKGTITIPLYLGHLLNGKNVWYVLLDVSDSGIATLLGLNYSPKLNYTSNSARTANLDNNGDLVFDKGTVDFSPVRSVVPGRPAVNSRRARRNPAPSETRTTARWCEWSIRVA
jgi:hypothetical protein